MSGFFLNIVNMSISASWIVLAVLLLRALLKKAPKWITVLLWGIVAVRLICPFSIESVMSLIPSTETINPEILVEQAPVVNPGIPVIDGMENPMINDTEKPAIGEPVTPTPDTTPVNSVQTVITVLSAVWLAGIAGMLAYTVISYFRVKGKIGTAIRLRENIFQSENVVSPFVLGIVKPKIYLPFYMQEQDMEYVIAHENAHIRRKDHWWKPIGFLILTLHWFNPLLWVGYVLLCRDIELACDEKVIKALDPQQKADYSQALLNCSVNRRVIAACPLAFGEIGVKNRVKAVLNYKKPAFWIIIVATIASVVAAVCFLTNPVVSNNTEMLMDVLNNKKIFISESGEAFYFVEYKPYGSLEVIPDKYALVDLDGDSNDELVVYITPEVGDYMVFHVYNNKVYGFVFGGRSLMSLKEDGSFVQSGGAGINVYACLKFEKNKYSITELAYKDDYAQQFRINGVATTAEKAEAYVDGFYNKPDVVWMKYENASNTPEPNDTSVDGTITIKIVDEEHLDDYPVNAQYYDSKAPSQTWKILVEATKDIKNFRFVELDESETLKVGQTIVELEILKANTPILLHTYINDVTLNRGISYQDDDGVVRYFGFNMNLNNGSVTLTEINPDNTTEGTKSAAQAYADFLDAYVTDISLLYFMKDIDNNGTEELIIHQNTEIEVYTYKDSVKKVGAHDFITGTTILHYTNDKKYPGIVYVTFDGGKKHFGYITVTDGALTVQQTFDEMLSGGKEAVYYTQDEDLIALSRMVYEGFYYRIGYSVWEPKTTEDPYAIREITDDRVTIAGNKKIFNAPIIGVSFSIPVDWKCLVQQGVDGSTYFFREPNLGENCEITMHITGSEYLFDRTKDEYLNTYLSNLENLQLDYYEKETLKGYRCIKAVYSYTEDNAAFTCIHYDNVVVEFRMYDFSITYPAAERDTYKEMFESIIDSIEFTPE